MDHKKIPLVWRNTREKKKTSIFYLFLQLTPTLILTTQIPYLKPKGVECTWPNNNTNWDNSNCFNTKCNFPWDTTISINSPTTDRIWGYRASSKSPLQNHWLSGNSSNSNNSSSSKCKLPQPPCAERRAALVIRLQWQRDTPNTRHRYTHRFATPCLRHLWWRWEVGLPHPLFASAVLSAHVRANVSKWTKRIPWESWGLFELISPRSNSIL